ncbi:hypothetical protein AAG747_06400 [Rapidithrix thailandica]|uniref:Uncharacterized protein n=1 Tax=Rapidithrix thailandica TaxID=413964 RepID=A0AAW9RRZ6_9BACT
MKKLVMMVLWVFCAQTVFSQSLFIPNGSSGIGTSIPLSQTSGAHQWR